MLKHDYLKLLEDAGFIVSSIHAVKDSLSLYTWLNETEDAKIAEQLHLRHRVVTDFAIIAYKQ